MTYQLPVSISFPLGGLARKNAEKALNLLHATAAEMSLSCEGPGRKRFCLRFLLFDFFHFLPQIQNSLVTKIPK